MALRLHTFGDPRLTDAAGQTVSFPEKAIIALIYLSSRPSPRMSRLEIANFLWGEQDSANALVNLRQLLARVKARQRELGVIVLDIRDSEIVLMVDNISSDLADLRALDDQDPRQSLQGFLRCFTGEFLAGIDVSAEIAQSWIQSERARLISRFANTLETVAARADVVSDAALIKDAAFRLLEFDAYSEVAYRALVKAMAGDGQLSQAKAIFNRYKDRLWKDLHAAPDQRMLDLTRELFKAGAGSQASIAAEPAIAPPQSLQDIQTKRVKLPRLLLVPPEGLAADRNASVLASSLLEDVAIGLCRAKTLSVVAPFTAQRIAGNVGGRIEAYARHDISYALETRLRPTAHGFSMFAGLVHLPADEMVWAELFDISPGQLPRSYNELIRRIAAAVVGQIERNEFARISAIGQPDAYQHYLIGQHSLKKIDLPDIRRARKSFKSALQSAPEFASALSGLARTEHIEWLLTARGDRDLLRSAETNSLKAILVDGDNAGGYHQLGVTKLYLGAFDESIDAFMGAEQSAPSHADMMADYADTLVHASDPEAGLAKIMQAIDLNPLCPDLYWWTAAGANYSLARYEDAIENLSHVEDQGNISRFAAACWAMLGDKKKAAFFRRKTMSIHPDFEIEKWLSIMPVRENWQKELYREGLRKAGFN